MAANKELWPNSFGTLMDAIPKLGGTKKDHLQLCIAVLEDYVAADGKYHPQKGQFPQPFQGDALGRVREMGPEAAAAAPTVAKIVEYHLLVPEGGGSMIIQAMQTLHAMGGGTRVALPTLQKAALNLGYKFTAEEAIKGILSSPVVVKPKDPVDKPKDPKDPMVKPKDPMEKIVPSEKVAPLLAALKDPAPEKHRKAVVELARSRHAGKEAVPMLTELLTDKDRETRMPGGICPGEDSGGAGSISESVPEACGGTFPTCRFTGGAAGTLETCRHSGLTLNPFTFRGSSARNVNGNWRRISPYQP